ncbi:glycoside hydrolase family 3 N-terminal domain-containing protein [Leucobacter soli]|uniref:Beta-hexosaminidase n=3 Tax=Leucobacter soli TaxID=2812850 RepID=A0A916JTZ8_9MICO|nr:Beta-hexosaminidase [Leucobacter soli]
MLIACVPAAPPTTTAPPAGSEDPAADSSPAPAPTGDDLRRRRAAELVTAMTDRERVASVLMGTRPGSAPGPLRRYLRGNGLGGFILMGDNVPGSAEELRELTGELTADPGLPPLLAIDQEGGEVSRIPWDDQPGADRLKHEPARDTEAAFRARTGLLAETGVNVNFGIVADVPNGEESFIYGRALGKSPKSAASRVRAAVDGARSLARSPLAPVASTLKHFPGHGAAEGDSHVGVPSSTISFEKWRETHARPFAAGIDAGAELLMFGHLAFTDVDEQPASLSPEWHRIAREDLGFDGVIVSDDLGMLLSSGLPEYRSISAIIVACLAAGTDLALVIQGVDPDGMAEIIDDVAHAVEEGWLQADRLQDAAERVADLRLRLGEAAHSAG